MVHNIKELTQEEIREFGVHEEEPIVPFDDGAIKMYEAVLKIKPEQDYKTSLEQSD